MREASRGLRIMRNERGREASRGLRIMSRQCVLEDLPAGLVLLFAGSQYCLCARIPLSVRQATAPVSNRPVNNNIPKRLPSDIIDRRNRSIKQKPERLKQLIANSLWLINEMGI